MIAYIRRHWRGEFSLAASLLINLPLGIAMSVALYIAGGKLLLGNVPRDVFGAWFWGGAVVVALCALWGVIGAVRCAIRLIGAPGGSLLGKLVPAGLLAAFVVLVICSLAEDLELVLRSR